MDENHSKHLIDSTTFRAEHSDQSVPSTKLASATTTLVHEDNNKENVQNEVAIHKTSKRHGYLSWDDYFLAVACLSSKRSKDPKAPSGACIVDQKNRIVGEYTSFMCTKDGKPTAYGLITCPFDLLLSVSLWVGIGYSGFPRGCSDSVFPWNDNQGINWLHSKDPYICQSVSNAILNKCTSDVAGARIYVMEYPNSESAKMILQSGIQEVVVLGSEDFVNFEDMEIQAGRILLDMANVTVRFFQPSPSKLCLDFVSKMSRDAEVPNSMTEQEKASIEETDRRESEKQRVAREALLEEANYDASKAHDNGKRKDFISWEDYL